MWNWILKALFLLLLCGVVFGGAGWFGYRLLVEPHLPPPEEAWAEGAPDPSLPDFEKAMQIHASRKPVEAREALERFLEMYPFSTRVAEARKALGQVNVDIFLSPIAAPEKIRYEIRSGDTPDRIKRKLKVSEEWLMRCNNLDDPRRLRIGQVVWVSQPDFSVVIDRKTQTVLLLNKGKFFKEYTPASWNLPARSTAHSAKVNKKQAWANGAHVGFGSKEYVGSVRWVELTERGYTLHTEGGAPKPSGGIGLHPEDMEELSTLLSKGVPVTIR